MAAFVSGVSGKTVFYSIIPDHTATLTTMIAYCQRTTGKGKNPPKNSNVWPDLGYDEGVKGENPLVKGETAGPLSDNNAIRSRYRGGNLSDGIPVTDSYSK